MRPMQSSIANPGQGPGVAHTAPHSARHAHGTIPFHGWRTTMTTKIPLLALATATALALAGCHDRDDRDEHAADTTVPPATTPANNTSTSPMTATTAGGNGSGTF